MESETPFEGRIHDSGPELGRGWDEHAPSTDAARTLEEFNARLQRYEERIEELENRMMSFDWEPLRPPPQSDADLEPITLRFSDSVPATEASRNAADPLFSSSYNTGYVPAERAIQTADNLIPSLSRMSYRPFDTKLPTDPVPKQWYERLSIRGYGQFRYNRLAETNPDLRHPQGDRSIGGDNGFFLRRARVILSGDVSDRVFIYIQPDFASSVGDTLHYAQLRDYYTDIFLNETETFRIRAGQSKIPYGFEPLQSSQNRIPLDRDDGLNTGVANERDIGLFLYWGPEVIRERFRYLVQSGLKGSGDYGMVGLGVYNGQTLNQPERNDRLHAVARFTWPYLFDNGQIVEFGASGYMGKYVVRRDPGILGGPEFADERLAWHLVWYPQPWGFQAEYNIGRGPELNESLTEVELRPLHGGYAMIMYRWVTDCHGVIVPFVRAQTYRGGLKHDTNSPRQSIDQIEGGVEWEIWRELELTAQYTFARRTSPVFPYELESGSFVRLQLQWNY